MPLVAVSTGVLVIWRRWIEEAPYILGVRAFMPVPSWLDVVVTVTLAKFSATFYPFLPAMNFIFKIPNSIWHCVGRVCSKGGLGWLCCMQSQHLLVYWRPCLWPAPWWLHKGPLAERCWKLALRLHLALFCLKVGNIKKNNLFQAQLSSFGYCARNDKWVFLYLCWMINLAMTRYDIIHQNARMLHL